MHLPFALFQTPQKRMRSVLVGSALLLWLWLAALLPVNAASPGTVVAWGNIPSAVPADLSGVTAIAASVDHTVASKTNGTVVAWGDNTHGQTTGTPATGPPFTATASPVTLSGQILDGVAAIAAGQQHTVALRSDGTVVAWGNNEYGQTTGTPSTSGYPFAATANPVTLSGQALNGVKAVSAGWVHTLALKTNGMVVAWGRDRYGQTTIPAGLSGVTAIAAGSDHSVALKSDGTVVAWGYNYYGQTTVPAGLSGVTAIAAGGSHTAALKSDGTVVAWGYNIIGQTTIPAGLSGVKAIAAGGYHTVALRNDGSVVTWGWNDGGQANVPAGLSGVTAIAAGNSYTVVIGGFSPIITTQPVGATVNVGQGASFSVANTGTAPLNYQWRKNGVDITGASSASLALSNAQTNQAGNYTVVITNAFGSVTSSVAVLTVNRLAQTITFGSLPSKRLDDAPFTLGATASSGLSVSYASSNPGVATVSGNTVGIVGVGSTTITAVQAGDATYLPAAGVSRTLVIVDATITSQPQGQSFTLGGGATLSVSATGTGLTYQWQLNGTNIPGATSSTLNLANLTATNAGAYRVVVSSTAGGFTTSQNANLLFHGDMKFYGGTTLGGPVGQQFRVDYADVLGSVTNWLTLTNVTLPSSPYLVIDPNSPGRTQRYYRAVPLP